MLDQHAEGVVVATWVIPNASHTEVAGVHDGALRLRVARPPADGEANDAVVRLLKEVFGGTRAEIIAGASSRRKRILLEGLSQEQVRARLAELGIDV